MKSCAESHIHVISILVFLSKSLPSSLLTTSAAVWCHLVLNTDNLLSCLFSSRVHSLLGKKGNIKMVNRKIFCRDLDKQGGNILVRNVHSRIKLSTSPQPWMRRNTPGSASEQCQGTGVCTVNCQKHPGKRKRNRLDSAP